MSDAGPPQGAKAPSGGSVLHTVKSRGVLYLVPAPLDFGCAAQTSLQEVLPQGTLAVAARLSHWITENAKSTRAYLKRVAALYPGAPSLQSLTVLELPRAAHKKGDHPSAAGFFDAAPMLAAACVAPPNGDVQDIGLVCEAGMPAIADPGASVVRAAHVLGLTVVPLAGPSSLLLALAASGMNGQSFAFVGYLPQDAGQRALRIRELEALALQTGQSQLMIETPYRNAQLLQALLGNLLPRTRLSVSCGLTLAGMVTRSAAVAQWGGPAQAALPLDLPAVFTIGQ
ncbi:MAG: ribosomal RNA small subunit methyltransferase I [Burkholderiaceae bacterium]